MTDIRMRFLCLGEEWILDTRLVKVKQILKICL